jgi:hypothetical protein
MIKLKSTYKSTIYMVHLGTLHLLGFGDLTLHPGYAGREEIFSTLRDDENADIIKRLQRIFGIKSNRVPNSLTNKWVETVKVVIVMNGTHSQAKFNHAPWRLWGGRGAASERGEVRIVRPG